MAPDAVIRLVERAGEIGAGVGQRKAVAAAPLVLGQPQHRDSAPLHGFDRYEVMHIEPVRHLEKDAAPMFAAAFRSQRRPGGVALRNLQRTGIGGLVLQPLRDMLGIAPLPLGDWFVGGRADQPVEVAGQPGPVDRHCIGFFDALDSAPLYEQPLDRVERCQFVMARLQHSQLGCDPEQLAEEIFEMGREIDQQVRFVEPLDRVGVAPSRHQPVMQTDITLGQVTQQTPDPAERDRPGHKDRGTESPCWRTRLVIRTGIR